jgi:hypothetical protein
MTDHLPCFLVRQFQEIIEEAQFVQIFHRRGMYGISPEISKEIRPFLEDYNFYPSSSEQIAEHDSRRTTAGNAAARAKFLHPRIVARLSFLPRHFAARAARFREAYRNCLLTTFNFLPTSAAF